MSCGRLAVMTMTTHGTAEARDDADDAGYQYQKHYDTDHKDCYESVNEIVIANPTS